MLYELNAIHKKSSYLSKFYLFAYHVYGTSYTKK